MGRRFAGLVALMALVASCTAPTAATLTTGPARSTAWCGGFDYPVGPPDAVGYYDAQPFGDNDHLGSDYNGNGGGDTDLGDAVHAVADGTVVFADDVGGGWGNVVRVEHGCVGAPVESLYAHLDTLEVTAGAPVARGDRVGTIGTASGQYLAHLHFELRRVPGLPIGGGYGAPTVAHVDPTAFIAAHRP